MQDIISAITINIEPINNQMSGNHTMVFGNQYELFNTISEVW